MRLLHLFFVSLMCLAALSQEKENLQVDYETLAFDKDANQAKDLELIKRIRHELINDMTLSKNGKNIKVIIVDKEITIKGAVETESERTKVKNLVTSLAGHLKLRDQLEIVRK